MFLNCIGFSKMEMVEVIPHQEISKIREISKYTLTFYDSKSKPHL